MGGAMGMGGAPMHHGGHHVGAYHPGAMAHAPLGAPGHQYAHGMYGAPHHPGALYPLGPDGLAHLPPGAGLPPHAVLHGVVPPGVPAAPFGGVGAPGAPGALHHPGLYHAYAHHPHAHHHHHHHHMGHIQMPPGAMHPAQPPHLGATMHGAHAPPPPAAGAPPGSPPGPPPAGAGEPDAPPDIPAIHDGEAYDGVVPLDSYGESARGAAAGARARARARFSNARVSPPLSVSPRALSLSVTQAVNICRVRRHAERANTGMRHRHDTSTGVSCVFPAPLHLLSSPSSTLHFARALQPGTSSTPCSGSARGAFS